MASLQDKYEALLATIAQKRNTYIVKSIEVRKGNVVSHDVKYDQNGQPVLSVLSKAALDYAKKLGVQLYESEAKQEALKRQILAAKNKTSTASASDATNKKDDTVLSEVEQTGDDVAGEIEPKKPGRKKVEKIEGA